MEARGQEPADPVTHPRPSDGEDNQVTCSYVASPQRTAYRHEAREAASQCQPIEG